jgi:peroxiredoxin Q/BCP
MKTTLASKRSAKITVVGRIALATGVVAAVGLSACGPVKRPDGGTGLLPVGSPAPDVEGHDSTGKAIRLSEVRGHAAVVYFYPKDGTPGCTHEACAFRDAFQRYQARGIVIFGVSRDSDESHKDFLAHQSLPFPLVSDTDGSVDRAYGVPNVLEMSKRVTFLVGPDGRVSRVWPDVDPAVHAEEVLTAAAAIGPPAAL